MEMDSAESASTTSHTTAKPDMSPNTAKRIASVTSAPAGLLRTPDSPNTAKRKLSEGLFNAKRKPGKSISLSQIAAPIRRRGENGESPYTQSPLASPISSPLSSPNTLSKEGRRKSEPFFNSWDYGNVDVGFVRTDKSPLSSSIGIIQNIPSQEALILEASMSTIATEQALANFCLSGSGTSAGSQPAALRPQPAQAANDDIIFRQTASGKVVVAGTIKELVRRLASEDLPDLPYINVFLLTHHYFVSSAMLLDLLIQNFNQPTLRNSSDTQYVPFVRTRIVHVIRHWITLHPYDFEEEDMNNKLKAFLQRLSTSREQRDVGWAAQINSHWSECVNAYTSAENNGDLPTEGAPRSILSRKVKQCKIEKFLDLDPCEVARQMTLVDYSLLRKVQLREFLPQSCRKQPSHNVDTIAQRFNQIGQWVSTEIICTPNNKQRVLVLGNMVLLAYELVKLNNLHGAFAVFIGLNTVTVQRLEATWQGISTKVHQKWKLVEQLMDPSLNFKNLRAKVADALPCIPPLVVILKDLTFMEENEDCFGGNTSFVNFEKMNLLGQVLSKVKDFQMHGFKLTRVPAILDYINEGLFVMDGDSLDAISKKLARGLVLNWQPTPLIAADGATTIIAAAKESRSKLLLRQYTSFRLGVTNSLPSSPQLAHSPSLSTTPQLTLSPAQPSQTHRLSF